eukprot:5296781-Pleurochrysis_carterae.AAC.1
MGVHVCERVRLLALGVYVHVSSVPVRASRWCARAHALALAHAHLRALVCPYLSSCTTRRE